MFIAGVLFGLMQMMGQQSATTAGLPMLTTETFAGLMIVAIIIIVLSFEIFMDVLDSMSNDDDITED